MEGPSKDPVLVYFLETDKNKQKPFFGPPPAAYYNGFRFYALGMRTSYNVVNFGANPQVDDPTSDDSVAIQRAIVHALANGVGTVFLPRGTYNIRNTIRLGGEDVKEWSMTSTPRIALRLIGDTAVLKAEENLASMVEVGSCNVNTLRFAAWCSTEMPGWQRMVFVSPERSDPWSVWTASMYGRSVTSVSSSRLAKGFACLNARLGTVAESDLSSGRATPPPSMAVDRHAAALTGLVSRPEAPARSEAQAASTWSTSLARTTSDTGFGYVEQATR